MADDKSELSALKSLVQLIHWHKMELESVVVDLDPKVHLVRKVIVDLEVRKENQDPPEKWDQLDHKARQKSITLMVPSSKLW